jgi:WhiB family redox-sensing transcriptional regulator
MKTGDIPGGPTPPGSWIRKAACTSANPDVFFPGRRDAGAGEEAKAICAECPVRAECLEYALATRQEWGVWGGANEHERQAILRARKRQPGAAEPPAAGAA